MRKGLHWDTGTQRQVIIDPEVPYGFERMTCALPQHYSTTKLMGSASWCCVGQWGRMEIQILEGVRFNNEVPDAIIPHNADFLGEMTALSLACRQIEAKKMYPIVS